ncbi:maltose alpha-D-glucosyltransferase [Fundidesulfovibrio butyratiphilus]
MWYKQTILYELHVRSFSDGDGDGVGDFKGLIGKLDYLERLGVGGVWLLPFYPSPLRDDGYDIADYTSVHPDYGTLSDFKRFLRHAHERGIKVITELVLNHTSDQHPWFQRARLAKPGSVHRDFYVWSETPNKYREARIIFKDFEQSNWAWDPVAKAYYWHRFYAHQPDLNYDNPAVRKAMLKVVDHWLGMGVDGLRLDAVPYLFERRGTNCENLPETHAFLKELRAHVDARYPGRMLLAEANQWPEDAVRYFGDGDECHMAFHFPVMPRIFMALWTEDRHPVVDILEQTPEIPATCQWATFLRNHDELTLEMVSDEERDYMYRAYASDKRARINLGIRRRLAPLMQNHRRRMEVINFLLFSFPGTPIIYYGDELGMGDNYHLGDRNGVRTPMQWSPDRNAGFSTANPQSLYLPVVIDPEYHYEVVNVETQEQNQTSWLWWMRRVIAMYKSLPALGLGRLEFVRCDNPKILSFLRIHEENRLLVLVNLSRYAQVAELELGELAGSIPHEVFGGSRFPTIGQTPYVVTLGPHDHFWLHLEQLSATPSCPVKPVDPGRLFAINAGALSSRTLSEEVARILAASLAATGEEAHSPVRPAEIRSIDAVRLGPRADSPILALADGRIGEDQPATRFVMLAPLLGDDLSRQESEFPEALLARGLLRGQNAGLADGFEAPTAVAALAEFLASGRSRRGEEGEFVVITSRRKAARAVREAGLAPCRLLNNTPHAACWSLGDHALLKIFRQPEQGTHPEPQMLNALTKVGFSASPELLAALVYERPRVQDTVLAVVQQFLPDSENGQAFVEQNLQTFIDRALAAGFPSTASQEASIFSAYGPTSDEEDVLGRYPLDFFRRLGQLTADLHIALSRVAGQAFAPEPFTGLYRRASYQNLRNTAHHAAMSLARVSQGRNGPPLTLPLTATLYRLQAMQRPIPAGRRIRIHGDYQLENILHKGRDLFVVDFDGDVRLPLGERFIKRSPLRDVADMLVSIAVSARRPRTQPGLAPADVSRLEDWTTVWLRSCSSAFLSAYFETIDPEGLVPPAAEDRRTFLDVFCFERILRRMMHDAGEGGQECPHLLNLLETLLKAQP